MNDEAQTAVENSFHFECKKDAMKQLQSGEWSIAFKVLADDIPVGLLTAAMGTRFVVAACEKNDDETAVQQPQKALETPRPGSMPSPTGGSKSFAQEAGILCCTESFRTYLRNGYPEIWEEARVTGENLPEFNEMAAVCVREICQVESRAQFDTDKAARDRWIELRGLYWIWLEAV